MDGSCPKAKQDEYAERGYDVVKTCKDCMYYNGCDDCYFNGNEEYPCEEAQKFVNLAR